MFTGIITHQGIFRGYRKNKEEMAVEVSASFPSIAIGESLSLNGACLSLRRRERNTLFFNLSRETLHRTNLGSLRPGERLNIELPLTPSSLISGHLVTGHIDGKGRVLKIIEKRPGKRLHICFPAQLRPYFISKGSVAVNGVSLTIAALSSTFFEVELIPLTLEKSNLGELAIGREVNIECDIIGKYVYNLISKGCFSEKR